MKTVRFPGNLRKELQGFPEDVRLRIGHELYLVQTGEAPSDFKSMPEVGAGVFELRIRDDAGAFRVIYVAKFSAAIYVLHAFQKKSQRTSALDLELAIKRYRAILE
jgi:phage-related protein